MTIPNRCRDDCHTPKWNGIVNVCQICGYWRQPGERLWNPPKVAPRKTAGAAEAKPTLAELETILQGDNPRPVGRCATTLTERYRVEGCTCPTYPGNEGLPCLTWLQHRASDLCVYCDHNLECHRRLSAMFTAPGPAPTACTDKGEKR